MTTTTRHREVVLKPTTGLSLAGLRDVWAYRELLWILAWRDVSVRYKQAVLGLAWAVLQPVTQMVIFTVLFNRIAGIRADVDVPYPVFVFSGLTVWMLFANGLTHASESLISSANLITKVYFPRVIVPLAAILTAVVDFVVAVALLVILMVAYGQHFSATAPLALLVAGVAGAAAAALGLWTSALNLQFRDVRYALPFFIQILIYLTPVFYPSSLVPAPYRPYLVINPMVAVVDSFRACLFGAPVPWARLGLSVAVIAVVGLCGLVWFRRMERTFADRV